MKIIGQSNEDYIVKVSSVELANILGLYSSWESEFREAVAKAIKNETNIPISKIYEHYYALKDVISRNVGYDNARKRLQEMLEALTPVEDLLVKEMEVLNEGNKA